MFEPQPPQSQARSLRCLWSPREPELQRSQMRAFMGELEGNAIFQGQDYSSLYAWSLEYPQEFWAALAGFVGIRFSKKADEVLRLGERMQDARWFVGAKLNFAENLIAHGKNEQSKALSFWNERGLQGSLSYAELYEQVARLQGVLLDFGVQKGDVIAGVLPNAAEAVIAMLATTSLGAVWTSCSPEFSIDGVLERFCQVKPKLLIGAQSYLFRGREILCEEKLVNIAGKLPSLQAVLLSSQTLGSVDFGELTAQAGIPVADYHRLIAENHQNRELDFVQCEASHPVYILYSSGTTGAPKCIVHGCIGTLLEHKKELMLHVDLRASENFFYRTTTGWMMWNWQITALSLGCHLCLYDGDLNSEMLFQMVESEKIHVFGSAAGHVQFLKSKGIRPKEKYDLSSLRSFLSTGSPLWPDLFRYVQEAIADIQIASISGGTDLLGCFALACPLLPVYEGELQARSLGLAVEVFNEQGEPIRGEVGELVCTKPFPSMPIAFFGDEDGRKYQAAYFDVFPGVWCHGDAAILHDDTGGLEILGRSDDTLNPGGERFGPAAITNVVDTFEGVLGSTAVAWTSSDGEKVVLFVKTDGSFAFDESFRERILQSMMNPRYRPARIIQVPDFPYTRSGKLSNKAIRAAMHGEIVPNEGALLNPEILDFFRSALKESSSRNPQK